MEEQELFFSDEDEYFGTSITLDIRGLKLINNLLVNHIQNNPLDEDIEDYKWLQKHTFDSYHSWTAGEGVTYVPFEVNIYGLFDFKNFNDIEPFNIKVSPEDLNQSIQEGNKDGHHSRTKFLRNYLEENKIATLDSINNYYVSEVDDNGNGLDFHKETWFVLTK